MIARAKMCFLPDNLEFLRAGGRVSNAVCMGSRILNLHPCIEILDGKLVATKKYRGEMKKIASQLIKDYADSYALKRDTLWLVYTIGLQDEIRILNALIWAAYLLVIIAPTIIMPNVIPRHNPPRKLSARSLNTRII